MPRLIKFIAVLFSASLAVFVAAYFLFFSTPQYAKSYRIDNSACSYQQNEYAQISFSFTASEKSLSPVPRYEIKEFPISAKTKILFYNIQEAAVSFTYEEITGNPLIEKIEYHQQDNYFVLAIFRQGPLAPVQISQNENQLNISLPNSSKNYPSFSKYQPADNSSIDPTMQKISVKADLEGSFKKANMFVQDEPISFIVNKISEGRYLLETEKALANEMSYKVKAIIIDEKDRASATLWQFNAQIIPERKGLDNNRFKYLGWWGKVNNNEISVMEEPNSNSKIRGYLSTANRVKVLKEVYGESINSNNLWYQIDGGAYRGAYVFSAHITAITQPQPPNDFTIPKEVKKGEYWIDFDLTEKILTLFKYNQPVFSTYASPGRSVYPTVTGVFRVWYKMEKDRMRGGPPTVSYYYDLPNVPYVLYYYKSYAIHGTYWHDKFGLPQSAGCTNLTQGDAEYVFSKTSPILSENTNQIKSTSDNQGSVIYNHY